MIWFLGPHIHFETFKVMLIGKKKRKKKKREKSEVHEMPAQLIVVVKLLVKNACNGTFVGLKVLGLLFFVPLLYAYLSIIVKEKSL